MRFELSQLTLEPMFLTRHSINPVSGLMAYFPLVTKVKKFSSYPSLVAKMVKNLPAMWNTWVPSLDWKDPLEKEIATLSGILVWRIPMDRGAWRATVHGVSKSQTRPSD